jgi:glycosyltransferase involved in cell wall biosynthesis
VQVVHLETGRHLYGGARQAGYLIESLAGRGVDNLVVCTAGSELAARLGDRHRVELIEWPVAGDLDWRLFGRLRQLLASRRPDLIHVHSRRAADTFGGRAARAAGVPAILTRRVQSAEPAFLLRFKCRPYAAGVAISRAVYAELRTRAGLADDRLRLIPSAVDTDRYRPDPLARRRLLDRFGLPADALIAAAAAQFIPRKGQDFLLELMRRLLPRIPRLQLLLFGQGPTRGALERRAAALGLAGRVRFCGFDAAWPERLPGIDLLLHPARREGLGSVVLEAMSAGVPVVAAAVGGLLDLVADGSDGRLLPADDADAWTQAVVALAADPSERARLAAAARRRVLTHFTIGAMTDRYLELYRRVAARPAAA